MEFLVFTGNRFGRWTGNRKFIWSGLMYVGVHARVVGVVHGRLRRFRELFATDDFK